MAKALLHIYRPGLKPHLIVPALLFDRGLIHCFLLTGEPLEPPEQSVPLLPLLVAGAVFLLVIFVLGVMVARRKREHSTLWFPEGFALHKDIAAGHKGRREPVGQDALGMK